MSISIGKYVSQKLKDKGISHKDAAIFVGLSKSAFEKILTQDDMYGSRLIKLSVLLNENLLDYYSDQEPIKTIQAKEKQVWQSQIDTLTAKVADQAYIILKQEEVIRLLKEKEKFLSDN